MRRFAGPPATERTPEDGAARAFVDIFSRLDPDPQVRGRQFELLTCWFLTNSPVYRGLLNRVWLWRDWPGRWGPDAGIDLVAETVDGQFWAIQAKAYDQTHWVTKADVDTFLSESGRPQFSYRLLVATTNHLGPTARRTIDQQEKRVGLVLLADLEKAEVAWPASPDDLRPARLLPRSPLPHQREAIAAVGSGLRTHERGQLISA